jgi:hypothetical protein
MQSQPQENIVAHELQFRVGPAFEIVMFNCDVVLAVALYVLLEPINPALALLGAFWRLGNAIVLGVSVAFSLAALDFFYAAHLTSQSSMPINYRLKPNSSWVCTKQDRW